MNEYFFLSLLLSKSLALKMKNHHACHIKFYNLFSCHHTAVQYFCGFFLVHCNMYLRFYDHINSEPDHVSCPAIKVTVL